MVVFLARTEDNAHAWANTTQAHFFLSFVRTFQQESESESEGGLAKEEEEKESKNDKSSVWVNSRSGNLPATSLTGLARPTKSRWAASSCQDRT
jgi:hypothetical protein